MKNQQLFQERRKEERRPASGKVSLAVEGLPPVKISGRLLDLSPSGFSAAHDHPTLVTAQEVRFKHRLGAGRARVVWNRILADHVESGFLILSS